jgi:hypothetical protein
MMIVTMVIIDGEGSSSLLSWACVTMAMKGCRRDGGGVGGGLLISPAVGIAIITAAIMKE